MGVTPPEFVVQAAHEEARSKPVCRSCCDAKAKACNSTTDSCCKKPQANTCCSKTKTVENDAKTALKPVIGLVLTQDYRKCRGMVEQFLDILSGVVLAQRITLEIDAIVCDLNFALPSLESSDATEPAVPPP